MTVPPPGDYPPPPPGNYPPPPPGNYPPPGSYPPPGAGPLGALPKEAYTSWFTRVLAWIIDSLPVAILSGVGQGLMYATGENNCVSNSGDNSYGVYCTSEPSALGLVLSFVFGLAALAFAVWVGVLAFTGPQDATNPLPGVFYVLLWVGLPVLSLIGGPVRWGVSTVSGAT